MAVKWFNQYCISENLPFLIQNTQNNFPGSQNMIKVENIKQEMSENPYFDDFGANQYIGHQGFGNFVCEWNFH